MIFNFRVHWLFFQAQITLNYFCPVLAQDLLLAGVQTTSGKVIGKISPKANDVYQFLGIPFAKPPINESRWLKPQEYISAADEVIQAVKQAPSCRGSISFMSGGSIGEDCL